MQVNDHVVERNAGLAELERFSLPIGFVLRLADGTQRFLQGTGPPFDTSAPALGACAASPPLAIWRTWRICANTDSMDELEEIDEMAMMVPLAHARPLLDCRLLA